MTSCGPSVDRPAATEATATLVLGGARSGKSAHAEALARASGRDLVYLATSPVLDAEWEGRVNRHKAQRGTDWRTVEEELDIVSVLEREARAGQIVLVDCLTLWLNNLIYHGRDVEAETQRLVAHLAAPAGPVILVSNEIGLGIVPEARETRAFRDAQGRLNQLVARVAARVVFVAAGLPLTLKPSSLSSTDTPS